MLTASSQCFKVKKNMLHKVKGLINCSKRKGLLGKKRKFINFIDNN